ISFVSAVNFSSWSSSRFLKAIIDFIFSESCAKPSTHSLYFIVRCLSVLAFLVHRRKCLSAMAIFLCIRRFTDFFELGTIHFYDFLGGCGVFWGFVSSVFSCETWETYC